ncbi:zinc finger protein 70-like isoform X2 [Adelges cooleyi]|uniref:zinc finger protein 70-like isoform X2 n=1 Tax=Adelges cooleyi TaxID=133065 RepID=UPI00217FD7F5|nr:zinc finger protein 70-like isoform X2 [Adelges cooleyi]
MSIYKKVDFYELCRLCMCVGGQKQHLFKSRESCDRQLPLKLQKCIPLQIKESDSLPKGICENCIAKVEEFFDFVDQCVNTESMLKSYCATLSVSDQMKCQGKVYVREPIEAQSRENSKSPKKNDDDRMSSLLTMQSLSNLVQSGSIQIVNDINSRYQDFNKYDMQQVITSTTPGVESMKYNYTMANNPHQSTQTDSSNDENDISENVQTIYSVPDMPSPKKDDSEMNAHSLSYVTPLTVEPEMLHFQFNKSDTDPDSDLENCKIDVPDNEKPYINGFLSAEGALASCTACGKVLESEEEIVMHSQMCRAMVNNVSIPHLPAKSTRDTMPPRFPCDVCEKKFKRKEHLIQHRKLHTGERPYSCETCAKSFSRKEHLMRHMLSHTGQRLYGCDLCHKHFSRKDNLHKHRTTHGVTGPLVCEICGKSFIVKHYYDMHMATHNDVDDSQLPYSCDICKKRFATSQFLVTHRFRHRTKNNYAIPRLEKPQPGSIMGAAQSEDDEQQQNQNQVPNSAYQVAYNDNNS